MILIQNQDLLYLSNKDFFSKYGKNLEVAINELFIEDRQLCTYLLYFKYSKYFPKKIIINNLLKNSLYKEDIVDFNMIKIEDFLITRALKNENLTHSIKILLGLKENRINNSRTSKLILNFIFNRDNLDFLCLFYKTKVRELLVHAIGLSDIQKILALDKKVYEKYFKNCENDLLLEALMFIFNQKYDYKNELFVLNINKNRLDDKISLKDYYSQISKQINEDIYLENAKYMYNHNFLDNDLIKKDFRKYAKDLNIDYKTAVLFDFSQSMEQESFFRIMQIYYALIDDFSDNMFFIGGIYDNFKIICANDSFLSREIVSLLIRDYKKIIVISDGFDNVYPTESIYDKIKELNKDFSLIHINTDFNRKDIEFKTFGDNTISLFENIQDLKYANLLYLLDSDSSEFQKVCNQYILEEGVVWF